MVAGEAAKALPQDTNRAVAGSVCAHYLRDLGQVSLSHALLARMGNGDWGHVRGRMRADLEDCYARV